MITINENTWRHTIRSCHELHELKKEIHKIYELAVRISRTQPPNLLKGELHMPKTVQQELAEIKQALTDIAATNSTQASLITQLQAAAASNEDVQTLIDQLDAQALTVDPALTASAPTPSPTPASGS